MILESGKMCLPKKPTNTRCVEGHSPNWVYGPLSPWQDRGQDTCIYKLEYHKIANLTSLQLLKSLMRCLGNDLSSPATLAFKWISSRARWKERRAAARSTMSDLQTSLDSLFYAALNYFNQTGFAFNRKCSFSSRLDNGILGSLLTNIRTQAWCSVLLIHLKILADLLQQQVIFTETCILSTTKQNTCIIHHT